MLVREAHATGGGCWDISLPGIASSLPNAIYCKTTISTSVSVEALTCVADSDTLCCDIDLSGGSMCNQVSGKQCYDMSNAGNPVTCTLPTVKHGDFACGVSFFVLNHELYRVVWLSW